MLAKFTVTFSDGSSKVVEADTFNCSPTHVIFQKVKFIAGLGPVQYCLNLYQLSKIKDIEAEETHEEDEPKKPKLDLQMN